VFGTSLCLGILSSPHVDEPWRGSRRRAEPKAARASLGPVAGAWRKRRKRRKGEEGGGGGRRRRLI